MPMNASARGARSPRRHSVTSSSSKAASKAPPWPCCWCMAAVAAGTRAGCWRMPRWGRTPRCAGSPRRASATCARRSSPAPPSTTRPMPTPICSTTWASCTWRWWRCRTVALRPCAVRGAAPAARVSAGAGGRGPGRQPWPQVGAAAPRRSGSPPGTSYRRVWSPSRAVATCCWPWSHRGCSSVQARRSARTRRCRVPSQRWPSPDGRAWSARV